jgi:hypothetical protein
VRGLLETAEIVATSVLAYPEARAALAPPPERTEPHAHRLRGFDALHLASYLTIADEFRGEDVRFSSADKALLRAARSATPSGRRRR